MRKLQRSRNQARFRICVFRLEIDLFDKYSLVDQFVRKKKYFGMLNTSRPVMSQYFLGGTRDGGVSMFATDGSEVKYSVSVDMLNNDSIIDAYMWECVYPLVVARLR